MSKAKAGMRGKCIAFHASRERKVSKQACAFLMQQLRKEEQNKSKTCRRKEIINRKAKINEIENRNQQSKPMKQKVVFFQIYKMGNPLATLTKTKRRSKLLISEMKHRMLVQTDIIG